MNLAGLLLNMLNYAARDAEKPLAPQPADLTATLESFGYVAGGK